MKKRTPTKPASIAGDDMRPEYDFTGGERGKYAQALRENGYTIQVYNANGTFTEERVAGEKTVTLAPDVQEYFPDSKAVNHALRTLISLVPAKRRVAASKGRGSHRGSRPPARRRLKV